METSLTAAVDALRRSGLEPVIRQAPRQWSASPVEPGAWVRMPGDEAYAVVTVADIRPGDRSGDSGAGADPAGPDRGPRVHRRVLRVLPDADTQPLEHGDPVAVPSGQFHSVFPEDVVTAVEDGEATWSVIPAGEPEARRRARLQRLARSKLAGDGIPVDIAIDPIPLSMLSDQQAEELDETIAGLFLPGIPWWFPRDRTGGRLAGRTQVLLRELVPPANPAARASGSRASTTPGGGLRPAGQVRRQVELSPLGPDAALLAGPGHRRRGALGRRRAASGRVVAAAVDALLTGRALDALDLCGSTPTGPPPGPAGAAGELPAAGWTDK